MCLSKKSKKISSNKEENQRPLSVGELSELHLYLSTEDQSIEVITKVDLKVHWDLLKVNEQKALYYIIVKGYSERETANLMGFSRRYIRDLKESGLSKLKEDL